MAKRTTSETVDVNATTVDADEVTETPALEDVQAAFSDVPDDSRVTLYRRQKDSAKWGLLDHMAPDMFDVAAVAKQWGAGTYRAIATARVKGKTGRPRVASVQFVVDPEVAREAGHGADGQAASPNKLAEVLEASYVQALSSMMQTMQATADAARGPKTDWVAIAGALSPVVVALLERRSDPLETAAKLVELTRPEGKAPEFSQLFDVFSQGLEFAQEQKPDSLSRIADTVTQLVERTSGPQSEGAPRMLPGDTQTPPTEAPAAAGPEWLEALRPFFPYLLKVAAAGKSPQLYAEWLVDQLPPQHVPAIVQLTAEPSYPENVVAVLPPQVAPLADWFRTFCLEVARVLEAAGQTVPAAPDSPKRKRGPHPYYPGIKRPEASAAGQPPPEQSASSPAVDEETTEDENTSNT